MSKQAAELRALTLNELEDRLDAAKEELFNLRFQHTVGQMEDTNQKRTRKREVARILTILREKKLEAGDAE